MRILVDAMGGDNAPLEIVKGSIDAIREAEGYNIILVGDKAQIEKIIPTKKIDLSRIEIVHTTEVITGEDIPVKAIRAKKDSSLVVAYQMLKNKSADVMYSAGNTGAMLAGALFILGRIEGVDRPAVAPVIPTANGGAMLIDAGLNTMCKPINYLQFAKIGSIYMKEALKVENPRVGLLNVGIEQRKGNELVKQAHDILMASNMNFVGNIEGSDLPAGNVDVAVCDGFVGNILLKFLEGVGPFIFNNLNDVYSHNIVSKMSYLTVKDRLRKFKKKLDPDEYGGTPILGVEGLVFKGHGNSKAKAVKNAIMKACKFAKTTVLEQIKEEFKNVEVEKFGI
ncbi:MAG: phosphate acyltransferase PlsX [Bacillota bacterium]|nr:phosphate acyltransferase PlsX [Bacillota bacterium]